MDWSFTPPERVPRKCWERPLTSLRKRDEGSRHIEVASRDPALWRKLAVRTETFPSKDGSACVHMGNTTVVCVVDGPKKRTMEKDAQGKYVNIDVLGDPRIKRPLQSAVRLIVRDILLKTQVDIQVSVINDDGGSLAAAMMATSLALCGAGVEVLDLIVAMHIFVKNDGQILVDPSKAEMANMDGASLTFATLPNLNQLSCCEVLGYASPSHVASALEYGETLVETLKMIFRNTLEADIG